MNHNHGMEHDVIMTWALSIKICKFSWVTTDAKKLTSTGSFQAILKPNINSMAYTKSGTYYCVGTEIHRDNKIM